MKAIKTIIPVFSLLLLAFTLPETAMVIHGQPIADSLPANDDGLAFKPGETLTYKVYYNWNFVWLSAGEVVFKVTDDGKKLHYQAVGTTYPSYEWFYKVHDKYDSWVDKETLLPSYSERNISEGDYSIFEKISYNQSGKKTTVWRSKKRGQPETKTEHQVNDKVHDILSTLYFMRNIDFASKKVGEAVPFSVFMDKEEFPLKMRYMGKSGNKKVHGEGRYNTLKFQPDVIAGNVFSEDAKMTVYVSDDQNRIPLLVESPVSVGSVKLVLKHYDGLKHPFTAKVK